jgi:hypothetical protein
MDQLPRIAVATFPKSGGALLGRVLRKLAAQQGLRFRHLGKEPAADDAWDVLLTVDGSFRHLLDGQSVRGIVVVRDPRELIVANAHRHARAEEPWLHEPRAAHGGRSYQQALNALPPAQRYVFEMDGATGAVIRAMLGFVPPPAGFALVPLEALERDTAGTLFKRIFGHFGLTGRALDRLSATAGELVRAQRERGEAAAAPTARAPVPAMAAATPASAPAAAPAERWRPPRAPVAQSGAGTAPQRWHGAFTPTVAAAFRDRFGDAAERLGYPAYLPAD